MKLKVLGRYTNEPRRIDVFPGDEIEVDEGLAAFLLRDAPGTFEDPSGKLAPPDASPRASAAARKEAAAIQDAAIKLLDDARDEAVRQRVTATRDDSGPKPFDLPPDGSTIKSDTTPSVITGPDSGVTVTHRASADEQAKAEAERQKAALSEEEPLSEEEARRRDQEAAEKALWSPPFDKQVKGAPKQK